MAARRNNSTRACCVLSELLDDAGIDRAKLQALRKQVLEGIVMMCRWQLERMERAAQAKGSGAGPRGAARTRRSGRRVAID
jgi:hypothetical protein